MINLVQVRVYGAVARAHSLSCARRAPIRTSDETLTLKWSGQDVCDAGIGGASRVGDGSVSTGSVAPVMAAAVVVGS